VVVLANNCDDGTEAVASALASDMPFLLRVDHHVFPAPIANAGLARRVAMACAAALAGDTGILLSTDADSVAPPNWIERNYLALANGADAVCGRVTVDHDETALIPAHLHADDALECELAGLLDRLAARLDPDPANPWPRHSEAAGASLAVTVRAFNRAGGIPALASGEDRAFVRALAHVDARIRHEPAVRVVVSGRTEGRARGGMADTIRRRLDRRDEFTDDTIEPAGDAHRRFLFRRRVRHAWASKLPSPELAAELGLARSPLVRALDAGFFGAAWANIEAQSPLLVRQRVCFVDLPREIDNARRLLSKAGEVPRPPCR